MIGVLEQRQRRTPTELFAHRLDLIEGRERVARALPARCWPTS
jgi:hypothetical protein